jgi:hypothetical protein
MMVIKRILEITCMRTHGAMVGGDRPHRIPWVRCA